MVVIPKTRKTAPYETALAIARLIILNYAPNVSSGNERMLALLFDMNSLWEEYILIKLKQAVPDGVSVYGQDSKRFWKNISIRPDIVIENDKKETFIVDTKWKNIDYSKPSTQDLRQMYVYNDYWEMKQNGEKTGSSGWKTNENANLVENDWKKNYFINKEWRIVQSAYQRIFIKHKN